MAENNVINRLLESVVSKTFIVLIGLAGAIVTIYAFLQDKTVDVRYEIIANTNVLDFNADISKLAVMYDSTNLKETKENLRIITVKIVNNGDQHLLKEYYDENEPLGLKISTGKIIEKPEIIQTSNDYLKRNLKIQEYNAGNQIGFSQVILESGEFYIVKFLILHKKNEIPKIISFGKIAGQRKITIVNAADVKTEQSFWVNTYEGNVWTQLLRLISYFLAGVLIIVIIIVISEQIDSKREKKRKRKILDDFKKLKTYEYTRMDDALFDRYRNDGSRNLKQMQNLLKDESELNETYKKISEELKSKEFRRYRRFQDEKLRLHYDGDSWSLIHEMINDGVIFKEQDTLKINQAMKDTLEKFLAFLKEKGEFKKDKVFRHFPNETITTTDIEFDNEKE